MKSRRGCYVLKCKSLWLQDWPKQITSGDLQETISPGGGGGWHQHNLPPQNLLVKKEKRMPWGGCLVTVHCFWLLDVLCLSSLAMPCWMCCVSVHRLCHVGCAVSQFIGHAMLDVKSPFMNTHPTPLLKAIVYSLSWVRKIVKRNLDW